MKRLALIFVCAILIGCLHSKQPLYPEKPEIDLAGIANIKGIIDSLDREEINSYIEYLISNNSIEQKTVDSLNLSMRQENLYYITIYAYLFDGRMNRVEKNLESDFLINYIVTIEIGDGISPMASINGNTAEQIYKENISINNRSIGTVRVWDLNDYFGGNFIFVVFDKDLNIYHNYLPLIRRY